MRDFLPHSLKVYCLVDIMISCHDTQLMGALPGIEPCPPDCSGCKFRGLHHCATILFKGRDLLPLVHEPPFWITGCQSHRELLEAQEQNCEMRPHFSITPFRLAENAFQTRGGGGISTYHLTGTCHLARKVGTHNSVNSGRF